MPHKLMIKTHNKTGLKYLCYTKKKNHETYTGSGKYWLQHLLDHGFDFTTELLLETNSYEEFKELAIELSLAYNVVESDKWANLRIEQGDGGDTVSDKRWITDGNKDIYILKELRLPEGWRYGRSNCVFNDSEKQKAFNKKSDRKKAGRSMKVAWAEGRVIRDNSKIGRKGDSNVSKRPEVAEKIKTFASSDSERVIRSERMKRLHKEGKLGANNGIGGRKKK
jgi:hypothetical protein